MDNDILMLQSLFYGLEKAMIDNLGAGTRYVSYEVGRELLDNLERKNKMDLKLERDFQKGLDKVCDAIIKDLKGAKKISAKISTKGNVAEVFIEGCILDPVREKILSKGLKPSVCPFTNILMKAIEKMTNKVTEIKWPIEVEKKYCKIVFGILDF